MKGMQTPVHIHTHLHTHTQYSFLNGMEFSLYTFLVPFKYGQGLQNGLFSHRFRFSQRRGTSPAWFPRCGWSIVIGRILQ